MQHYAQATKLYEEWNEPQHVKFFFAKFITEAIT